MFVLCCTHKLLDSLNSKPDSEPPSPDTGLGDWYATLIRVGRIQVVLPASERTLLSVLVPTLDGQAFAQWLSEALM
jgi:hypothetical protein